MVCVRVEGEYPASEYTVDYLSIMGWLTGGCEILYQEYKNSQEQLHNDLTIEIVLDCSRAFCRKSNNNNQARMPLDELDQATTCTYIPKICRNVQ